MNRNLITRMGVASGVVAALVAAAFALLVTAVREQRDATDDARQSEQVVVAAADVRRTVDRIDIGRRGGLGDAPEIAQATVQLPLQIAALQELADRDGQRALVDPVAARADRFLAAPGRTTALALDRSVARLDQTERRAADERRDHADAKAAQAIALGVGGLIGSAVLIALLTLYLARYVVVPLRRTVAAARRLTLGDLTTRVAEQGDAEPVELARAFNRMAESLQESEQIKDEFIALVSHELRTPLTSIIGYLELVIDDEQPSEEARRFLEIVDRNAKRLLRLVGDMLFVAQVEAGNVTLECADTDVAVVAEQAIEAAIPAAARAGVVLRLESQQDSGDQLSVWGDRDRLGQMIDNLLSNAIKFSSAGDAVAVRVMRSADRVAIEIADEGAGIASGDQPHLFERFYRSPSAAGAAVPGAGLGLAIVKTIIEAHDGEISISSSEGSGTTVAVLLPAKPRPDYGDAAPPR